jgi:hypothetical protein
MNFVFKSVKETGYDCVEWIKFTQNRDHWQAFVNIIKLCVP